MPQPIRMKAMQGLETDQSHPLLCDRIAQHIAAQPHQRITFADFMRLALYDPDYGYYATNRVNIGPSGDFYTAPHLGADFGELLAEQFADMWRLLGYPQPFTLVEMGAGQGLLVRDVLRYLHRHHDACFEAIEYIVVEASPALRQQQQQRMAQFAENFQRLSWRTWEEIPLDSVVGCFFSNELVDALPVHRVVVQDGKLQEVYVVRQDAANGKFGEAIAPPSTAQLTTYLQDSGINLTQAPYLDGYTTEINLASLDWLSTVAQRLQQGYVLTIDYGYSAPRYYLPSRCSGTLQCYFRHHHHDDPFINIGSQDITAHVNFTALERHGKQFGLESLGLTQQGLFLMALGMGDRIAALSHSILDESFTLADLLARREALHGLIDPMGLGNFGVLLQGKRLAENQRQPRGLQIP